jgi:hypothetical protein
MSPAHRTADMSAACYDELPQHEPSTAAEIGSRSPLSASAAATAGNGAHKKAPYRDFQALTLPSVPPVRGDLSSLNSVSFPSRRVYKSRLRYRHLIECQNPTAFPLRASESWHRPTAERRASTAAEAPSERRLSGSRARARLCHLSHHSAERRRDWAVMRD